MRLPLYSPTRVGGVMHTKHQLTIPHVKKVNSCYRLVSWWTCRCNASLSKLMAYTRNRRHMPVLTRWSTPSRLATCGFTIKPHPRIHGKQSRDHMHPLLVPSNRKNRVIYAQYAKVYKLGSDAIRLAGTHVAYMYEALSSQQWARARLILSCSHPPSHALSKQYTN